MATIFRPYRRTRDGQILYARDYGLRAWPMDVDDADGNLNPTTPIGHGGPGRVNVKPTDSGNGNKGRKS